MFSNAALIEPDETAPHDLLNADKIFPEAFILHSLKASKHPFVDCMIFLKRTLTDRKESL